MNKYKKGINRLWKNIKNAVVVYLKWKLHLIQAVIIVIVIIKMEVLILGVIGVVNRFQNQASMELVITAIQN